MPRDGGGRAPSRLYRQRRSDELAAPRPAQARRGGGDRDLGGLFAAGNKAVTQLLGLQRQDTTTEQSDSREGAPDAPLLDAAGITDAKSYYKAQPWNYPPDIVNQIRVAVGLGAGGIDDAMVLGVAAWQTANGTTDPGLVVDGKAGPRTLPRLFKSGLNRPGEGEKFGGEAQTEVIDEWANLASATARRDRLIELVNERLAAAGVPPVKGGVDKNPSNNGSFDFTTWRMLIGTGVLGQTSVSKEEAEQVTATIYHEARHAEQWFRMAQLRAGQRLTQSAMVQELGIPARIARLAKADPLPRGSMQALIAQGWWDSVYGHRASHRNRVLNEVDAASKAAVAAKKAADANPTPQNQAKLAQARARFEKAFAQYQNLPEENDAFATEVEAALAITGGSPAPPVPDEEPAGSPPSTGGTLHDVAPEDDLP